MTDMSEVYRTCQAIAEHVYDFVALHKLTCLYTYGTMHKLTCLYTHGTMHKPVDVYVTMHTGHTDFNLLQQQQQQQQDEVCLLQTDILFCQKAPSPLTDITNC